MINLESLLSGVAGNLNPAVAGSISVVIGLLALLFGYRLFRAYLFVVGFAVGTIAASAVTELPMALLCGLLAGLACIVLWYVGLFLLGAACGVLLTLALGITFTPLVVAVAILFGILAVVIRKLMIIVSTSWTGAGMILGVVGPALGLRDPVGMLLATLALAAAGVKPAVVIVPMEEGHLVQPLFPHLKHTKRFYMRPRIPERKVRGVRVRVFW